MFRIVSILLISFTILLPFSSAQAENNPAQKAILVTGASSGLGRAMTEMMASNGYFVYAGARKDKDMQELNAIENVQAVRLDVNKQDEIDAAVKTITNAGRGLYGLVNNAGVVVLSPLIEPGTYQSKIGDSAINRMNQRGQTTEQSQYQADMDESVEWLTTTLAQSGDPSDVSKAVMHALFDASPKPRYLVVPNQEQAQWTINRAMERLVELNASQKYSYDREALIEMLDKAMAEQ